MMVSGLLRAPEGQTYGTVEEMSEHPDDPHVAVAGLKVDGRAFARVLIDDGEALEGVPAGARVDDEVLQVLSFPPRGWHGRQRHHWNPPSPHPPRLGDRHA